MLEFLRKEIGSGEELATFMVALNGGNHLAITNCQRRIFDADSEFLPVYFISTSNNVWVYEPIIGLLARFPEAQPLLQQLCRDKDCECSCGRRSCQGNLLCQYRNSDDGINTIFGSIPRNDQVSTHTLYQDLSLCDLSLLSFLSYIKIVPYSAHDFPNGKKKESRQRLSSTVSENLWTVS